MAKETEEICSFCKKYRSETKQMFVGTNTGVTVYICDSCIISSIEEMSESDEFDPAERAEYRAMATKLRIVLYGKHIRSV